MDNPHNIAIQLTPPGAAAIAVVRLCGPRVTAMLANHFSRPPNLGRCVHGEIRDGEHVIDDAVVALCDPTTADVNVHGGPWVVHSVLDLARRHGFELLDPRVPLVPEAVDGQTEIQSEILQYLPLARTELGVRVLLGQQQAWESLNERAIKHELSLDEVDRILADQTLIHLLYPPSVAIVGAANVGKSTLANQLFGQQRSITADIPGTTRDWVGEIANIDGLPVMLLDTPGQRETRDAIEHAAIEKAGEKIAHSQLLILVLDCSRPFEGEQEHLLAHYPGALKVMNKADRSRTQYWPVLDAIETVATTGQGVEELRFRIVEFFCDEPRISIDRPRSWTVRQRRLSEMARKKRPHGGG